MMADEIRRDRGAARPGLDRFVGAGLDRLLDLLEQVVIYEKAFLDGTCHGALRVGLLLAARRAAVLADEDHAAGDVGAPARREALRELAPRRDDLLAAAAALRRRRNFSYCWRREPHHHGAVRGASAQKSAGDHESYGQQSLFHIWTSYRFQRGLAFRSCASESKLMLGRFHLGHSDCATMFIWRRSRNWM